MNGRGNPFSTRHTRPGAIPFVFAPGESAAGMVERLAANDWWGQIVGPHGAGKTTLLHALLPEIESTGRRVRQFRLRQGQRALGIAAGELAAWDDRTQVIVDGYEQLGWLPRIRLQMRCRRKGAGLLVTAHRTVGLPPVAEVRPSRVVTRRLVRQLWPEHDRLITDREIDASFDAQRGNVRETLFALYDLFEARTGGAD